MDEEGNKIECIVDKSYVILGQALEEYADVYIHKPTLVTKCIGFNGPKNSFAFANFQDLIDKAIPSTISFGIAKCIGFNGPKNSFAFVNFQDLIDKAIPSTISFGLMKKKIDRLLHVLLLQRLPSWELCHHSWHN
ncbi:unnamed protein product [Lactuca virosa]|uniref:Uncharacterized protein n=1 Tax=Lactuca virosa TaxID=75947 RepID=A0AAU9NNE3_9ASTR|nr:unnamed protein product [Lactuca virosa]